MESLPREGIVVRAVAFVKPMAQDGVDTLEGILSICCTPCLKDGKRDLKKTTNLFPLHAHQLFQLQPLFSSLNVSPVNECETSSGRDSYLHDMTIMYYCCDEAISTYNV